MNRLGISRDRGNRLGDQVTATIDRLSELYSRQYKAVMASNLPAVTKEKLRRKIWGERQDLIKENLMSEAAVDAANARYKAIASELRKLGVK